LALIVKLFALALILAGCAGRSLIQEETEKFVGQPLTAVTDKLGAPIDEHTTADIKIFVWSSGTDGEGSQGKCTIRATMRGDVIGSFDWEGSESQCAHYTLILKGPNCRKGIADLRIWLAPCT
jgi:hypothetical protein